VIKVVKNFQNRVKAAFMLEKKNRINLNKEFDRAFKTGQSFYAKVFSLKSVDNNLNITRFGLLVGLKVSKKAVIRNKLKRQIRSIISQELPLLKDGKDIVVVIFPLILEKNFAEIKIFLKNSLTKLNLYK
jgi:ribonuclease P protein component